MIAKIRILPSQTLLQLSVSIVFILMTGYISPSVIAAEPSLKADPNNTEQVKRGNKVYQRFCSLCHGINLEGQANWRVRKPDGKLPAPPHDETGHTWHHADDLLFGITKFGLVPPYAPANYQSDMPAWESTLKDGDIWAVLAYIKSRWPAKARQRQAQINLDSQQ